MDKMWQVIIAGSGGQGLGLAGRILAEAAMASGLYAAHNQSYGARARGGYSQSSVIISPSEIIFPFVEESNLVIALSQQAHDKNVPLMAADGMLIYDTELVQGRDTELSRGFPLNETARKACNSLGIAVAALGAAVNVTNIVPEKALLETMKNHFSEEILEVNRRCFGLGMELGEQGQM